jgi:hypothetical protein
MPLKLEYPELFSFVRNKEISVAKFLSHQYLPELFFLPLSSMAYQQLQVLQSFRDHFPLTDLEDTWSSQWGSFLSKKPTTT